MEWRKASPSHSRLTTPHTLEEHTLHITRSSVSLSMKHTHPKQFKQCVLLPEQNPSRVQTTSSLKSPAAAHNPTTMFRCRESPSFFLSAFHETKNIPLALIRKIVVRFCSSHLCCCCCCSILKNRPLLLQMQNTAHTQTVHL